MGGINKDIKLIDENGKRIDGRSFNELRPIKIEAGVLERADGSAYIEWGNNKIIAAVYGPREVYPKHMQDPSRAVLRARYNMAAFSVDERKKPGPDRRSIELSLVISNALSSVVLLEQFPRTAIDVFIEVLQADAGTRIAGLTAASVALADAGIPMKDLIVGCAAGKVDNTVVLDLNKEEDNYGQADLPVAIIPRTKEIVLFQMDGDMTFDEVEMGLNMAIDAALKVYELQKDALRRKYINLAQEDEQQ
ncbi:MAG: exosome complex exonuclease Rrp41 [Thermoplasmata archaeon]|nr:exosome complex exonuclease Rrp41 [Thermoplasmata archaeon]MVT13531.1 exosome complex exonuclease Rrp41 [Euryarchaeota archaeon]MVT14234.1 exosome complex exonuclease Rrp41 [Euryarchaeota archaeon]MVT35915.1 exosome complex exonuclease Rrp41 [Euryarchaeota archaeon]